MAQTKKKSAGKAKSAKKPAKKPTKAPVKKSAASPKGKNVAALKKTVSKLSATVKERAANVAAQMKKPSSPSQLTKMITPLDDRVIVAPEAAAEATAGGIIIPGSVSERPNRGTVLAKGRGRRNKKGAIRPLDVNVGDIVLFPQFAGQKIEIGAEEFLILREEEILAISLA